MDNSRLNIDLLPVVVRDIADRFDLSVAMLIVEKYGGTRLWVPEDIGSDHELVVLLGLDTARKFCHEYSKEFLPISKSEKALRVIRDQDIILRLENGETKASVALAYGLTERQIYYIQLKHYEETEAEKLEPSQASMF